MKIIQTGILGRSVPGTARAVQTFSCVVPLSDTTLFAACRAGTTKDSADEAVTLYRSHDRGNTWSEEQTLGYGGTIGGAHGSLKVCYLTELAPGHLIAACMWIDRETYPGQPLFNPATEGCLPMFILLADSHDYGATWGPWRVVDMPEDIGPASLTNPIMQLPDNTLVMSIETNKHYHDASPWMQRVVLFHSHDLGQTWGAPVTAGEDPTGRIFNWDQRAGVAPDGRIGTFLWTYDSHTLTYLNIHRRISTDGGYTWSEAEDLGVTDQAAHPAILPDGRVVLAWVDRFHTHSIRARLAAAIDAPFDAASEVVLYTLENTSTPAPTNDADADGDTTGDKLAEMGLWTFGLPYCEAIGDDEVLVLYYAGTETAMDVHTAHLRVGSQ